MARENDHTFEKQHWVHAYSVKHFYLFLGLFIEKNYSIKKS